MDIDLPALLEKLSNSPKAYVISQLKAKNIVVITTHKEEKALMQDLSIFSDKRVLDFPAWETFSKDPSKTVMAERIASLSKISKNGNILLTSILSFLQKVPQRDLIEKISFKKGGYFRFSTLTEVLTGLGYEKVPKVLDKGQYALRAGILDLFLPTSSDPYRIEFFDDDIVSIRSFDTTSQRSIEKHDQIDLTSINEKELLSKRESITLADYLEDDYVVVFDDPLSLEDQYVGFKTIFQKSKYTVSFDKWITTVEDYLFFLKDHRLEDLFEKEVSFFNHSFKVKRYKDICYRLPSYDVLNEYHVTVFYDSDVFKNELKQKFPKAIFKKGAIEEGFVTGDKAFITEQKQTARSVLPTYHKVDDSIYSRFVKGDYVVHAHSGIAKYAGTTFLSNYQGEKEEFIELEYADNNKTYVPMVQSHLISRYLGSSTPDLSSFGSSKWKSSKKRAEKAVVGYAKDIISLQAERENVKIKAYPDDSEEMKLFEMGFQYPLTIDQSLAINDVKADFKKGSPMDRLILGDVGYGKTEIAIRAAFKTAMDANKQVAILVPTAILALQHYNLFRDRMKEFPLEVAIFTASHATTNATDLLNGKVDIVIGTHKLLGEKIDFYNLGLLIIDEEQRFGVRAKNKLKSLKAEIHCLTLSATPIPRTLYLSLVKIRDISVIQTAPKNRLSVSTFLIESDDKVICKAIIKEIARNGQCYFLHNSIKTIEKKADHLRTLVPSARVEVVHGRLQRDSIRSTIKDFSEGEIDILVATTVIENGIDIPNANTIFINDAHKYGVADLYQIRGRVGRSDKLAFAYFIVPSKKFLNKDTKERLRVLLATRDGYSLALRDLEARGCGEFLGTKQSGQIDNIGLDLYRRLLKKAISCLRKKEVVIFTDTIVDSEYKAELPLFYVKESSLRMEIYRRMGELVEEHQLKDLLEEIEDRFGPLPKESQWLCHLVRIRLRASAKGITKVVITPGCVQLYKSTKMVSHNLNNAENYKLLENEILRFISLVNF